MDKKKTARGLTPMDAALRYLGYQARTAREVERHLDEKQFGEVEIMETVDRLTELGLIDDTKYASDFIESRLRTKPVSRRKLREQLTAHEVPKDVIDEALSALTDEDELAHAKEALMGYLASETDKNRLARRLMSRGFDYGTVRRALEDAEFDMEESEPEDDFPEEEI